MLFLSLLHLFNFFSFLLYFFCVSYSVFLILSSTLCPFFIHCSTFSPFLSVSFSQCSVFHFLFINSSTCFFPFLRFSFSFISRMYSLSLVSPVFLVARSNFLSTVVCYLPFSLFIFLLCTPFPISAFAPLFHSICLPALCFNALRPRMCVFGCVLGACVCVCVCDAVMMPLIVDSCRMLYTNLISCLKWNRIPKHCVASMRKRTCHNSNKRMPLSLCLKH